MLEGYQKIPDEQLFSWQPVELLTSIEEIFSKPGVRTACQVCGEEIINEREIVRGDQVLCRGCAGFAYYAPTTTGSIGKCWIKPVLSPRCRASCANSWALACIRAARSGSSSASRKAVSAAAAWAALRPPPRSEPGTAHLSSSTVS